MTTQQKIKRTNTDFNTLLEYERQILLKNAEILSNLVAATHDGEKGRLNEMHLAECLRKHLPKRMGVGTGFIRSSSGIQTRQQDLIIYDALYNTPLYDSEEWTIYPIEMVYATIEVKTTLTKTELKKIFEQNGKKSKNSTVQMAWDDQKHYLIPANIVPDSNISNVAYVSYTTIPTPVPPRFYSFAYFAGEAYQPTDGKSQPQKAKTKESRLQELTQNLESLSNTYKHHVHGLCLLEYDWFFSGKSSKDPNEYSWNPPQSTDGFKTFLQQLQKDCDTLGMGVEDRSQYS